MPIYIVKVSGTNFVKIGFSKNVEQRIKSLKAHIPFELDVVRIINGTIHQERILHDKFYDLRINGEWFNFHKSMMTIDVDTLKKKERIREKQKDLGNRFSQVLPTIWLEKLKKEAIKEGHTVASLSRKIILDWLAKRGK